MDDHENPSTTPRSEGACEVVSTTMRPVYICGQPGWRLFMPEHRAAREEWPWWEWPRLASMRANLGVADIVYDIGTEEGDQSALYQSWVGGEGGGIVLVEPNPPVWANVKAIWEANALDPPLACFVGFATEGMPGQSIGAVRGLTKGWPACADGPMIGDHGFMNVSERPDVDRITIDRLAIETEPPTALTIDTEGSELLVLRSAPHVLTEYRPLVWVSIHPQFSVDMYGLTRDDLLDYMRSVGYQWEHLAAEHELHTFFFPEERRHDVCLPYSDRGLHCGSLG